ncbi:hypothetical protein GCM10008908_24260 [Clostridium subterminale]|uniref:Uncharacterized protein n=1 Tax=Clostridium subterminale TaxID=1550 RepID=A0ABP3W578_CLOSU
MEVRLNKSQFVSMACRDLGIAKPTKKKVEKNEADVYIYERQSNYGRKDAMHKKRRPGYKSK